MGNFDHFPGVRWDASLVIIAQVNTVAQCEAEWLEESVNATAASDQPQTLMTQRSEVRQQRVSGAHTVTVVCTSTQRLNFGDVL